jgi:hypothetical protein
MLVKGQNSLESLIDAMFKIIKKNGVKHPNLDKPVLREVLLHYAFLDAAGIASGIEIPNELSESFHYELLETYIQYKDVKFPGNACTGHCKYLGEDSSHFDSIHSLKTHWDSKVYNQLCSINLHFCELLADLLKMAIFVWVPYVNCPGVFSCTTLFGPQYPDFCFVAFFPYELEVNFMHTRSPGGLPQSWTMSKYDIESKANFFCPIEMSRTKIKIRERPPSSANDPAVVFAIRDNKDSITDMILFDYFAISHMRNNKYIHPIDSTLSSSKKENTFFQHEGMSYIHCILLFFLDTNKNKYLTENSNHCASSSSPKLKNATSQQKGSVSAFLSVCLPVCRSVCVSVWCVFVCLSACL